ncbi:MAG: beta-lactamase family protein [Acidimicrobiia bacterium]|nr:beta-lactamase family protein [Acidimicrobiia bacterium]
MDLLAHRRVSRALLLRVSVWVLLALAVAACSSSSVDGGAAVEGEAADPAELTPAVAPTAVQLPPIDLQLLLDDWVSSEDLVGAVAAVATIDDMTVASAGLTEIGTTELIGPNHRFRIGSITKLFTATLVMRLVEGGVLGLDDPVSAYLPDAPPGVTIAQLLSHRSGIVDQGGNEFEAIAAEIGAALSDPSTVRLPAEVVAEALGRELAFEPGTNEQYSNVGYLVLDPVIETAAGTDYESALIELVLEPAGLDNTGVDTGAADMAAPHERLALDQPPFSLRAMRTDVAVGATTAAGGLVSDVYELVAFAEALFGGEIVSASSLEEMMDTTQSAGASYGLGMDVYRLDGRTVLGHDGRTIGYGASLRHDPTTGLTVVVLANEGTFATRPFADRLVIEASRLAVPE